MNKEQKKLYKKVDEILWNDWGPIGVNDVAPRDEYQSYVPEIFSMLIHNKTKNEIADRLYKIEIETIDTLKVSWAKYSIEVRNPEFDHIAKNSYTTVIGSLTK